MSYFFYNFTLLTNFYPNKDLRILLFQFQPRYNCNWPLRRICLYGFHQDHDSTNGTKDQVVNIVFFVNPIKHALQAAVQIAHLSYHAQHKMLVIVQLHFQQLFRANLSQYYRGIIDGILVLSTQLIQTQGPFGMVKNRKKANGKMKKRIKE